MWELYRIQWRDKVPVKSIGPNRFVSTSQLSIKSWLCYPVQNVESSFIILLKSDRSSQGLKVSTHNLLSGVPWRLITCRQAGSREFWVAWLNVTGCRRKAIRVPKGKTRNQGWSIRISYWYIQTLLCPFRAEPLLSGGIGSIIRMWICSADRPRQLRCTQIHGLDQSNYTSTSSFYLWSKPPYSCICFELKSKWWMLSFGLYGFDFSTGSWEKKYQPEE